MQHLEEGTIHAWLDGALSGDEAAGVEAHVRQCAQCAAAVGEARGLIAGASRIVSALDVVPGGVIPRPKSAAPAAPKSMWNALRFTPMRAAIAATLLVGVASMFTLDRAEKEGVPRVVVAFDTAVPERVAAPAAVAPAPPAPAPSTVSPVSPRVGPAVARSRASVAKVGEQKLESRTANAPPAAQKAVADAAGFTPRDSARPVVADSTRAVDARAMSAAGVSAEVSRRDAPGSAPVRRLNQTESPVALTGCFRAAEDPATVGIALPQRFSLERDTARNVLRKLDDAGRAEAVVGAWRQLNATSVLITLENREQRSTVSLTRDASGALTAQASDPSAAPPAAGVSSRAVSVSRIDCGR